jgi:Ser/Thr protein kinase RdoA (MazF antagonist)
VMDDAGNGRRGARAAPSATVLAALRERYGITGSRVEDLGGSSNLNLLVAGGHARYVVRVYRPYVTAGRLAAIHQVRRDLTRGGVPCADVVPTRDGRAWASVAGRLLEVERFVGHDAKMDSWDRLERGLPLLGRIHSLLRAVAVSAEGRTPLFANHVGPAQAQPATARGTARIRSWQPTPGEERLASMADELAGLVGAGERDFIEALPRQLVHGDFWDNNVLLRDERVVLVADFDFMGERARIDDLALTLYFADATFGRPEPDESWLARLRRLVDAYDSGLDRPLTALERAALPWAMARQPLWGIGGWVASLDDAIAARHHAAGMVGDVAGALHAVRAIDRWRQALA